MRKMSKFGKLEVTKLYGKVYKYNLKIWCVGLRVYLLEGLQDLND
jgi:hypothetical protein